MTIGPLDYEFEEQIELNGITLDPYFSGCATIESDRGEPMITAITVDGSRRLRDRMQSGMVITRRIPAVTRLDKPAGEPTTLSEHMFLALAAAIEGSTGLCDAWAAHVEEERADAA